MRLHPRSRCHMRCAVEERGNGGPVAKNIKLWRGRCGLGGLSEATLRARRPRPPPRYPGRIPLVTPGCRRTSHASVGVGGTEEIAILSPRLWHPPPLSYSWNRRRLISGTGGSFSGKSGWSAPSRLCILEKAQGIARGSHALLADTAWKADGCGKGISWRIKSHSSA